MIIHPDLPPQGKINVLLGAESNVFWQVLREGFMEMRDEQQKLVNDLRRTGELHENDRRMLKFMDALIDGEFINAHINTLKEKIPTPEIKQQPQ